MKRDNVDAFLNALIEEGRAVKALSDAIEKNRAVERRLREKMIELQDKCDEIAEIPYFKEQREKEIPMSEKGIIEIEQDDVSSNVSKNFQVCLDELDMRFKNRYSDALEKDSAKQLADLGMGLERLEYLSYDLFQAKYGSEVYKEKMVEYALAHETTAVRAAYNLAAVYGDDRYIENSENAIGRLKDENLDVWDRAGAANTLLQGIVHWTLYMNFRQWIRDGRKIDGKDKGSDNGSDRGPTK